MAQLAIKGHATRGKEVIEILEMLGGKNIHKIDAIRNYCVYFVMDDKNKTICSLKLNQVLPQQFIIYSLEEFEEKFPYKVGDKVTIKDDEDDEKYYIINKIIWNGAFIQYDAFCPKQTSYLYNYFVENLQPYKEENYCQVIGNNTSSNRVDTSAFSINEETMEEPEPKAPILSNRYDYAEGKCGYVIPDGYEFDSIKQGFQTEIILKPKKPQYPKTYEECCKIIDYRLLGTMIIGYKAVVLRTFQKLLVCRNAYWKIAREQMGLGKPWEPDWNDCTQHKFGLYTLENEIRCINLQVLKNIILVFPTEEMRDAFFENFKDLIEQCKELL